jgi:hypothetical protein
MKKMELASKVWKGVDREKVYEIIDKERDYQDKKWGGARHDAGHEVGSWLIYMRHYMKLAEAAISTSTDDKEALQMITKVIALGVACLEYKLTEK